MQESGDERVNFKGTGNGSERKRYRNGNFNDYGKSTDNQTKGKSILSTI